ncbi:hypothetical protein L1F28_31980 [Arthrospira platensis NCB002]|uniref:hypothetical protein n=1 Tax=Limnospira platensis TaxID=118562 RepID=UPI0001D0EC06|nr:hypothetical protein [Arthrospira platensis NCB002]BAI91558.1 hypothetical protein NIES39_J05120 [Arthrospira platensis NIES-39]
MKKYTTSQTLFWLFLSMSLASIYGILSLKQAFAEPNLVHNDARQHIFWMLRFIDPNLFPNDLIADYFQSVAPRGYTIVYKLGIILGINPFDLAKIIPPILGLFVTYYFFRLCLEILPIPATGFIGCLIINQALWLKDDLASGTPRAFINPIFIAFLYYLVRHSRLGVCVTVAAIGLFYPQYVFMAAIMLILRVINWQNRSFKLTQNNRDYQILAWGLLVAFIVLLPYIITSSEFGPTITRAEAMNSPEFFEGGRSRFFHDNLMDIWFTGRRSGMFHSSLFTPATQCVALLLPFLLIFPRQFPLGRYITPQVWVLLQLFISSVLMFFASHALLFRLHLPGRYTEFSFRIIIALLTAISLTLIWDTLLRVFKHNYGYRFYRYLAGSLMAIMVGIVLLYPAFVPYFPLVRYEKGRMTEVYDFFQQQPPDIVIASLSAEADQLPTFAQRTVLMAREYAIPYHLGYYNQILARTLDMINAHYTDDLQTLQDFINQYNVDFWLIDPAAFSPEYIKNNHWMLIFSEGQKALNLLENNSQFALYQQVNICRVFEQPNWWIVDTKCILNNPG